MKNLTLVLGEIVIAEINFSSIDGKWLVSPGRTFVNYHPIGRNKYNSRDDASDAARKLVPVECRNFIRAIEK